MCSPTTTLAACSCFTGVQTTPAAAVLRLCAVCHVTADPVCCVQGDASPAAGVGLDGPRRGGAAVRRSRMAACCASRRVAATRRRLRGHARVIVSEGRRRLRSEGGLSTRGAVPAPSRCTRCRCRRACGANERV
jgi:hypothetical protein